jgi:hypothetical protein
MSILTAREHDDLVALAGQLDNAAEALPATVLPPEPRLRQALDDLLARRGRVLVDVDRGETTAWVTTTVADEVADRLATAGIGVLAPSERAVLALVLLRCVVAPTAAGAPPASWHAAERVPTSHIKASKVPDAHVTDALGSLHRAGLVDAAPAGVKPGPALDRLTARARRRLERDLVEIVAGDNPAIRRILDRLDTEDPRGDTPTQEQT